MAIVDRGAAASADLADLVEGLRRAVGDDGVTTERARRLAASTDHSWLSPGSGAVGSGPGSPGPGGGARGAEAGAVADVVVSPADTVGLARAMALAYRADVPLVPRGQGTSVVGAAVPERGGIVLESERRARVLEVGAGWVEAEAGATFVTLDRVARASGQELALCPSTIGSALGGFLGGGTTGAGSLEHGSLWDGFVLEVDVLPAWDAPEPISAVGDAAHPFLHACGTTGVVVSARVALVPARPWTALFASFPSFEAASATALGLAGLDPPPRSVAVDDAGLVDLLPGEEGLRRGRASLRACLELGTAWTAARLVAACGGTVERQDPAAVPRLASLAHEHVVLWARQARAGVVGLQVTGAALLERPEEVRAAVGGGLLHHDLVRRGGRLEAIGLVVCDLRAAGAPERAVAALTELGLAVRHPGAGPVADGGLDRLDLLRATATQFDPKGLLNPGKLAGAVPSLR